MSMFYVLMAIFILLNSCIGFSSSPYYERYTSCNQYNVTPECNSLHHRVDVIYSCELLGSIVLVVHGNIGMILLDNMRSLCLARVLNIYSKISILVYAFIIVVRVSYYMDIVHMLQPANEDQTIDNTISWFTGMLTINVRNQTEAIILSCIFLTMFVMCFISDAGLIYLTTSLIKTLKEYEEKTKKSSITGRNSSFERKMQSFDNQFDRRTTAVNHEEPDEIMN